MWKTFGVSLTAVLVAGPVLAQTRTTPQGTFTSSGTMTLPGTATDPGLTPSASIIGQPGLVPPGSVPGQSSVIAPGGTAPGIPATGAGIVSPPPGSGGVVSPSAGGGVVGPLTPGAPILPPPLPTTPPGTSTGVVPFGVGPQPASPTAPGFFSGGAETTPGTATRPAVAR